MWTREEAISLEECRCLSELVLLDCNVETLPLSKRLSEQDPEDYCSRFSPFSCMDSEERDQVGDLQTGPRPQELWTSSFSLLSHSTGNEPVLLVCLLSLPYRHILVKTQPELCSYCVLKDLFQADGHSEDAVNGCRGRRNMVWSMITVSLWNLSWYSAAQRCQLTCFQCNRISSQQQRHCLKGSG